MADLAHVSDDDLCAEIGRRDLLRRHGIFAFMQPFLRDYAAMWSGICTFSAMIDDRDGAMSRFAYELRTELHRLVDDHPIVVIGPVNTTFFGAEDRIAEIARAA